MRPRRRSTCPPAPIAPFTILAGAQAILFNVGDFVALSSFALVIVAWVLGTFEAYAHLYSRTTAQRFAWVVFLSGNSLLYLVQIGLYVWLFLAPAREEVILQTIYGILATLNLASIVAVLVLWLVLWCHFSGFPISTRVSRARLTRLRWMVVLWTFSRLVWGILAVVAVDEQLVHAMVPWQFGVIIATVFLFGEVLPSVAVLAVGPWKLLGAPTRDDASEAVHEQEDDDDNTNHTNPLGDDEASSAHQGLLFRDH